MNTRILTTLLLVSGSAFAAHAGPGNSGNKPQVDANGDGAISKAEVAAMQAEQFGKLDLDGNGEVSADELTEHTLNRQRQRIARMAEMQVKRLDADGDGGVSEEEFTANAQKGFDQRDKNSDGKLTRDEMRAQAGPRGQRGQHRERQDSEG